MRQSKSRDRIIWKGVVAGAAAGLVATWAMTEFQNVWSRVSEEMERERHQESFHSPERGTGDQKQGDDATMKTADWISRALLNRGLTRKEKQMAGPIIHYSFGSATGALYGALAESVPAVTAGRGSAFGSAVFVLGDEIAVPALGLSGPITESPISVHIYAWVSHLVYGLTLERTRILVRGLISDQKHSRPISFAQAFWRKPTEARSHRAA